MNQTATNPFLSQAWIRENIFLGKSIGEYIRSLFTPFNFVAALIILGGLPLIAIRYATGLGFVTNSSNDFPWGLYLGWGLFGGVPLSSTGFIMASTVYLFGMKQYHSLVRPAVLTGFVGYFFAVVFLLVDLGKPWHLPYPMILSFGTSSVLFLVAWHVALYLSTQFVEFCPAIFEWMNADTFRRWAVRVTIGATIFGVILSTLHQSALGAMFLVMPAKVHPLWYTPYIPLLFFVSSIYSGLSMIILESTLIRRFLPSRMAEENKRKLDGLTLGLGKGAALTGLTYFALKWTALAHGNDWGYLGTGYGAWFLFEVFGLVLTPCILFTIGVRQAKVTFVRVAAALTVVGILANRITVALVAYNWRLPHEFPGWKEIWVVATIVTIEILVYRWVVNRLPVHMEHPAYASEHVAAAGHLAGSFGPAPVAATVEAMAPLNPPL